MGGVGAGHGLGFDRVVVYGGVRGQPRPIWAGLASSWAVWPSGGWGFLFLLFCFVFTFYLLYFFCFSFVSYYFSFSKIYT